MDYQYSSPANYTVSGPGIAPPIGPQPDDPWKHRSAGMRCRTCMWFVRKHAGPDISAVGRCRRHAPTMGGYPVVMETDWCGDHRLDENKV